MALTRHEIASLNRVASTPEALASTDYATASTNSSQFVPDVEAVEAVEAIPLTDIESLLMNSEDSQNLALLEKGMGLDWDWATKVALDLELMDTAAPLQDSLDYILFSVTLVYNAH